jgi:hypothetical protein
MHKAILFYLYLSNHTQRNATQLASHHAVTHQRDATALTFPKPERQNELYHEACKLREENAPMFGCCESQQAFSKNFEQATI